REIEAPAIALTFDKHIQRIRERLANASANSSSLHETVAASIASEKPYAAGGDTPGAYVTGPGPNESNAAGFLPLSLAVSFFFMWTWSGAGQPSNMVRLMAFRSSSILRRSVTTVAIYYSLIYF